MEASYYMCGSDTVSYLRGNRTGGDGMRRDRQYMTNQAEMRQEGAGVGWHEVEEMG